MRAGERDEDVHQLWSILRRGGAAEPSASADVDRVLSDTSTIERMLRMDPALARAACPASEDANTSPSFGELKDAWVRVGDRISATSGLRPGQIVRVVMLYQDGIHCQVDELSRSAMRFIGVDGPQLLPFDCRGWLPLHAAAFYGWPAQVFAALMRAAPEAADEIASGTDGLCAVDLLPPSIPGSVWRLLMPDVVEPPLGDIAACSELLWWLMAKSADDPTAADAAAALVASCEALSALVGTHAASEAQQKGALVRLQPVPVPQADTDGPLAAAELGRVTKLYPYLVDGLRDDATLAREVNVTVLTSTGSGRDVELLMDMASQDTTPQGSARASSDTGGSCADPVEGPPLQLISAFNGLPPLHCAALLGWPPAPLKRLLACTGRDTASQIVPGTDMSAPHLARVGGAPMESVALLAAAAFQNRGRALTDEYAAILQCRASTIADDESASAAWDERCVSTLVEDLGVCPERLLLAAAVASDVSIARILIERYDAKGTQPVENDGRIARDLGFSSSDTVTAAYFGRLGALLGRYRIDKGPPVHRSLTCVVHFAIDIDTMQEVCLKRMRDFEQFGREIRSRAVSEGVDEVVVRLLGWHTPSDSPFPGFGQRAEPTDEAGLEVAARSAGKASWALQPVSINTSRTVYPYLLVMQRGGPSLQLSVSTQRVAGCSAESVCSIFCNLARQIASLHQCGLVHCDIKLRNALVRAGSELISTGPSDFSGQPSVLLCDLDSSLAVGESRAANSKLGSSAYQAPEVARWAVSRHAKMELPAAVVSPELDVWSLGVVLFELCTGRHLFPQDISNDEMVESMDMLRLCSWLCISDDQLKPVFAEDPACSVHRHHDARHLIRWCLQGDPAQRPTMTQILEHRFFRASSTDAGANIGDEQLDMGMKFHLFVSHLQTEAAGDVGTLCLLFEKIGLHCWRDMDQDDLTEAGMRQGVQDSDVFVLFLTNSVLSSPWCNKEIGWAIDFGKPIITIVEKEERFYAFDIERWRENRCSKRGEGVYKIGHLRMKYEDCPAQVKSLVEQHHNSGNLLPFRRRDFQIDALAREVVRRASQVVCWGSVLPPPVDAAQLVNERWVSVVCDDSSRASQLQSELMDTLKSFAPGMRQYTRDQDVPSMPVHTIVMLSARCLEQLNGVVDCGTQQDEDELRTELSSLPLSTLMKRASTAGVEAPDVDVALDTPDISASLVELMIGCRNKAEVLESAILRRTGNLICVFIPELGWSFDDFYSSPESPLKSAIADHELLEYKTNQDTQLSYEHTAMAMEILRRMRRSKSFRGLS
eukprot:COSAG01_NODE_415_length_17322_cov_14.785926_6_plen_1282_part_00